MARALLVGCGCRGRSLGSSLLESGWAVRGTTRSQQAVAAIEQAGIEGVVADPDRVGSILDHVGDVTVLVWLMGSAQGSPEQLAALAEERLASLLEKLVDTPVRGFVLERAGTVPEGILAASADLVEDAARRWSIPARIVTADPAEHQSWLAAMEAAVPGVLTDR